ncbi:protein-glutamate methylesterase/protein-glutamine glutaminase [Velocimicrobium porci]|nr:chemotaxis response regulator protein-glutamate methylesterase [Velocimicrobium porci]
MKQIKVLVVEDSLVFRELLVRGIESDPALKVVAQASNPYEARDAILKYRPDVMTLDVVMPRMDGIEFLRKLIPQYPLPAVVVSVKNRESFEALNAGAVDFVSKPNTNNPKQIEDFVKKELNIKIKIASTAKMGNLKQSRGTSSILENVEKNYGERIIAIGASTGGTEAIATVIKNFKPDIPGTVIVQHMPPGFTTMYAERLNNQSSVFVKEAQSGDIVERGKVLLAPGDLQMRLTKISGTYRVECKAGEKVSGHCPSVDVLFHSVAANAGSHGIGVLLTGMGADGAKGLLAMRRAGAETIGQDEASCVVYGMPKVAYEIGAVKYQVDINNVAPKIYNILNGR